MEGKVVSLNIAKEKGVKKRPVEEVSILENHGILGDAHASPTWHRQISLLALESIEKMRAKGLQINPGDFAENITVQGIDLLSLPLGTRIQIGEILCEVSQIGKECHQRCQIFYLAGDCIMPREGIFARVLKGGKVRIGDKVKVILQC